MKIKLNKLKISKNIIIEKNSLKNKVVAKIYSIC